jgi:hypothetical protein
MLAYVEEYKQRHTPDDPFVNDLARDIRRSVRVGALWGWVNAADEGESERCLAPLADSASRADRGLARLMRLSDAAGLDAGRRRRLAPTIRTLGNRFRV